MTRLAILAPMTGRVVPIEEVPDPVFSEKMIGDGLAIDPVDGHAVAPVAGTLLVFHSAGHAFAVETAEGLGVLVHVGLDTVALKGQGFTRLSEVGKQVRAGQEIVRFDLEEIQRAGLSPLSPIVVPQLDENARLEKTSAAEVRAGQDVLLTIELPDRASA
jgi:glucose-specific phosphotransferase system IIA component